MGTMVVVGGGEAPGPRQGVVMGYWGEDVLAIVMYLNESLLGVVVKEVGVLMGGSVRDILQ